MQKKNLTLSKLLTLFLSISLTTSHNCVHTRMLKERIGHPKTENPPFPKAPKTVKQGRNLAETWHNMIIKVDYSNVSGVSQKTLDFVQKTVMPMVTEKFEKMLKVKGTGTVNGFTSCSEGFNVPASFAKETKADLVVLTKILNEDDGYLAYAGPCIMERGTNKPVVGIIVINEKYLQTTPDHVSKLYETLLHEVAHILAVSPSLYGLFDTNETTFVKETRESNNGSDTVFKLVSPNLLAAAREHFGCSSLSGVYLENEGNEGSAGAHFEKVHYGNELMTAQDVGIPSFSKISLALFEDSNWYKVDYNLADEFYWGKNKGCGFINDKTCSTKFSEYCQTESELGCNDQYTVKTSCAKTDFSDNCLVNDYNHNYVCSNKLGMAHTSHYTNKASLEVPGAFSRCFHTKLGSNKRAGCFPSECNGSGKIVLTVNKSVHTCNFTGEELDVGGLIIVCPDNVDFCQKLKSSCSQDCNGNGMCSVGKTCYCDYFHLGSNCATKKNCSGDTFCETLQNTATDTENTNTSGGGGNTDTNTNTNNGTEEGDIVELPDNKGIIDEVIDFFNSFNPLGLVFGNLFLSLISLYTL